MTYFHELTKEQRDAIPRDTPIIEVAKMYPQPSWCAYPDGIDALGCWSLIGGYVTGEDFCQRCECHRRVDAGLDNE